MPGKKVKQELLVKAARCWINKDDKVAMINVSKESKETMIKEAKRRYDASVPWTRGRNDEKGPHGDSGLNNTTEIKKLKSLTLQREELVSLKID